MIRANADRERWKEDETENLFMEQADQNSLWAPNELDVKWQ